MTTRVEEKKRRLANLKAEKENIELAVRVRVLLSARFGPTQQSIDGLTRAYDQFSEALDGLGHLLEATHPAEELQRMADILLQKDEEWIDSESGSDFRLVLCHEYLRKGLTGSDTLFNARVTLEKLRAHRSNDVFHLGVANELPALVKRFADTHEMISNMLQRDRSFQTEVKRQATTQTATFSSRLAAIDSQITALEKQIAVSTSRAVRRVKSL